MKKINIFSLAMALLVLISSCSQDLLETPSPSISDESYFTSDEAAVNALVGVYDVLGRYNYTQIHEWMIGDIVSDDAEKGGEGPSDWAECQDLKDFRANPENSILTGRWQEPYVGINRANKLIVSIEGNELITENGQKLMIAEAKFLRAWYHFHLTKVFGPIPIVTKVLQPAEYKEKQNTVEEVYAQIEKDLIQAIPNLPDKSEQPADHVGRATKGAAQAFLVKMYVFQGKWQEAADLSDIIIKEGQYSLEPNYEDVFTSKGQNGVESIFEIQYLFKAGDDSWGDANEGNVTAIYQGSRELYDEDGEIVSGWGWGFNLPTQDLYEEFEADDPRLKATIIADGDVVFEGTPDEEKIATQHINSIGYETTVYHSLKYYIPKSERNDMSDSPNNWRAIRYADLLLWNAEAKAQIGGDWETPLQEVRDRVDMGESPIADPLQAIYHERRVELAMESHRYWDLVRTGRGDLMDGYADNKRYFPIPQGEISLNPNLEQNPY